MKNSLKMRLSVLSLVSISVVATSALAEPTDPMPEWQRPLVKEKSPNDLDPNILKYDLKDVPRTSKAMIDPAKFEDAKKGDAKIVTFRRPKGFDYEFALLVEGDQIRRAFVVSTAKPGKTTINGSHRLVVPSISGKAWPWRVSMAYQNSPMYWAVQIHGGYFVHSSPHYGNLGKPASMGCVRTSLPDAQEIFDLVANKHKNGKNYSIIFDGQDAAQWKQAEPYLNELLASSNMTVEQLKARLVESRAEVTAVSTGDLDYTLANGKKVPAEAHVRPFTGIPQVRESFPKCEGQDCWDLYPKAKKAIVILGQKAHTGKAPEIATIQLKVPAFDLKAGGTIMLKDIVADDLSQYSAANILDVTLTMTGKQGTTQVRVCDKVAVLCSKVRGPVAGQRTDSVYPMYQIAEKLKSSEEMYLESTGGTGTIEAVTIRFNK